MPSFYYFVYQCIWSFLSNNFFSRKTVLNLSAKPFDIQVWTEQFFAQCHITTGISVLHRLAGMLKYVLLSQCIAKKLFLQQRIAFVFSNDEKNLYLHINGQEFYAIIQNKLYSAIGSLKEDIFPWTKIFYNGPFWDIIYRASICNCKHVSEYN